MSCEILFVAVVLKTICLLSPGQHALQELADLLLAVGALYQALEQKEVNRPPA